MCELQGSVRCAFFHGQVPLPVEPLYSLPVVALLVPCALETLRKTLKQFPDVFSPPHYVMDSKHILKRMLTASEVRWLRAKFVRREKRKRSLNFRPPTPDSSPP